jgi:hypothetical protein
MLSTLASHLVARTSRLDWRRSWGVIAAGAVLLAGCGSKSDHDQVIAAARAYESALVARDATAICRLTSDSVHRLIATAAGPGGPRSCTQQLAPFLQVWARVPSGAVVSDAKVNGRTATVRIRSSDATSSLSLVHEHARWTISATERQ